MPRRSQLLLARRLTGSLFNRLEEMKLLLLLICATETNLFSLTEELSQSYGKMVDVAIKYDCQPLFGDNKRKIGWASVLDSKDGCQWLTEATKSAESCSVYWAGQVAPVVMLSMDGFRPEYFHRREATAALRCVAQAGVKAPFMQPAYPTLTFPNHYTLVTGLYPESHGIVNNAFHDPHLDANFSTAYANVVDGAWWRRGEALWVTTRRQGLVSAAFFWAGSDVLDGDHNPNYWMPFNKSVPLDVRVTQVLKWLDLPADRRPAFTALYSNEPDFSGHLYGPQHPMVTAAVASVDAQVKNLVQGLIDRNIWGCVNLIVVSDHGMTRSEEPIDLKQYLSDLEESARVFYGPVTTIQPVDSSPSEMHRIAESLECRNEHMRVWTKWDLPYRLHFAHSDRIPHLVLDLDSGWEATFGRRDAKSKGRHGWDNLNPDLQAVFLAVGPSFRKRLTVRPFENIQVYNLVCALLRIKPAENNGTWGALHHLLVDAPPSTRLTTAMGDEKTSVLRSPTHRDAFERQLSRRPCRFLETPLFNEEAGTVAEAADGQQQEATRMQVHGPLGYPNCSASADCALLIQEDYVTAFDQRTGDSLWTQYVLRNDANVTDDLTWRLDPRLKQNHCHKFNPDSLNREGVRLMRLFPMRFATIGFEDDVRLETNAIKVAERASQLVDTMAWLLAETQRRCGPIGVVTGPTRRHYDAVFYVVSLCASLAADYSIPGSNSTRIGGSGGPTAAERSCPIEGLDVQAFLLPLRSRFNGACVGERDAVAFHVATLRDVERVTGLRFFPHLSADAKLQLLTRTSLDSRLVVEPARSTADQWVVVR